MTRLFSRSALAAALACALLSAPVATALAQDEDGGHEAGAEGHGEGDQLSVMDVVSDIHFQGALVNFCLLLALLIYVGQKPVTQFFEGRKKQVLGDLEEAARLKRAAEEKYAEYSGRLEKLDEELALIRKDMAAAGAKERDRIIADAEGKSARMRRDAEFVIDQQMKQLRDELTQAAVAAAVDAARDFLMERTSADDQQNLADAYLERLKLRVGDAIDTQGGV